MYVNIQSIILHNHKIMETTQMSLNEWMGKQTVVHPHDEILLNNKKEITSDNATIWVGLKCIMLSEGSQTQKAIYTEWFHFYDILE